LFLKLGVLNLRFNRIPEIYVQDFEFPCTYVECLERAQLSFYVNDG